MNKFYKKFLGIILSSSFLVFSPIMVKAENIQDLNVSYQNKIENESIDSSNVNQENWQDQEKDLRENYNTAIAQDMVI